DGGSQISVQATSVTNDGTLRAEAPSILTINGTLVSTKPLVSDPSALLAIQRVDGNGGNALNLTGGGAWHVGIFKDVTVDLNGGAKLTCGTLNNVTLNGDIELIANNGMTILNGLKLNGTARLGDGASYGHMDFKGTQTL